MGEIFYTGKGEKAILKQMAKDKKTGKLTIIFLVNGKEKVYKNVDPSELKMLLDRQEEFKKIAKIKGIKKVLEDRKKFIDENGITRLYHYTDINNIESILKHGILSRNELTGKNIEFTENKTKHNLNGNDISMSISHINYNELNRLTNHSRETNMIVLVTNTRPLMMLDTEFARSTTSLSRTDKTKDIKVLFDGKREYRGYQNKLQQLPNYYPTNPNSEALVKNMISAEDIMDIISLKDLNNIDKKKLNDLAFDYGMGYYTVNEYEARCDEIGMKWR